MSRKLVLTATLASAALLTVAGTAMAEGSGRGMGRGREEHPVFVFLLLLAVAAAAIVGTWLVIRRGSAPSAAAPAAPVAPAAPTAGAEVILAERLARSEISPDDYRSMLAALRGTPMAAPAGAPLAE